MPVQKGETKMEQNKERINKFSKGIVNVAKVGKILSIVGLVFCVIGLICIGVTAIAYDPVLDYIRANPNTMGAIEINLSESSHIYIALFDKTTLLELFENKDLALRVLGNAAIDCIEGAVTCAITLVLMNLIKSMFLKLENADSPFNTELNGDLKKSFIGITILVLINSTVVVALIVGLVLVVVYYLYQYGASLQKDVDETI